MADVKTEKDPERLRQMAVLLDDENVRLHKKLAELAKEVAELRGQTEKQAQTRLESMLNELQTHGSTSSSQKTKSERRKRRRRPSGVPKKRTQFGPREQTQLDVDEKVVELPEETCACESCGLPLKPLTGGFEESEYIDVIERTFIIRRTKRQKYKKTCACEGPVVTAPHAVKPDTLGGRYSIAFCAAVAEDKFCNHLPMRRQERAMGRLGLELSANVLFSCLWALASRVSATYEAIQSDVLTAKAVHIDETGWPALNAKEEVRQLWGLTSEQGAYFRLLSNRSHEGAATMLRDYDGWVLSDGLKVYDKAGRLYGYNVAGCWSHGRRYFFNCEADFPEVTEVLDWMDELFRIEREIVEDAPNTQFLAYRQAERDTRSRPLVEKIERWVMECRPPPGTKLKKAVNYLRGQFPKLKRFLNHPEIPLSNNLAEQILRSGVIGRKNYQGTRSKRGEIVVCMMYTVLETARIRGINGREYLEAIARHDLAEDEREKNTPADEFVRTPLLPADFIRLQSETTAAA